MVKLTTFGLLNEKWQMKKKQDEWRKQDEFSSRRGDELNVRCADPHSEKYGTRQMMYKKEVK
ncbi:hypothetical protein KIN20_002279 [Parelaphostrongylus tenuis]|uniref:Uncharacterized protein n=1 Tax=Parelaphostrongylus tenuis TaxID=148309 RepID=A0AAD5LY89_PARTN|nr:hypothetical protein KIN20_002279 [Parelaphostrongylus tenuis]